MKMFTNLKKKQKEKKKEKKLFVQIPLYVLKSFL